MTNPDQAISTPATEATAAPAAEPAAPEAEYVQLTREEFNRQMAQARRDGEQRATKKATAQPAQTSTRASELDDVRAMREELAAIKAQRSFDRIAAEHRLTPQQSDRLFTLYRAEQPEDASAWLADTVRAFNLAPSAPSTVATQNPPAVKPPVAAPADSQPRAVGLQTSNGLPDLAAMTPEDRARLGPQGLKAVFAQISALADERRGKPPQPHLRFTKKG